MAYLLQWNKFFVRSSVHCASAAKTEIVGLTWIKQASKRVSGGGRNFFSARSLLLLLPEPNFCVRLVSSPPPREKSAHQASILSPLSFLLMSLDSKYVGLILAICSSFLIGTSFVITKKGLQQSSSASQGRYHRVRASLCQ